MKLEIKNITAGYDKTMVLKNINLQANTGGLIGLVGPNGSGKSCLLKVLAGLINPASGEIFLNGEDIIKIKPALRAKKIAWLSQTRQVGLGIKARELVALGRAPFMGVLGRLGCDDNLAIDNAIKLAMCEGLQESLFDDLSGGEQARVLLARLLASNADLILADEPISALDPYYQINIMQILAKQAQEKIIIVSLHDLGLARQFCSRILVLDNGELIADGKAKTALSDTILQKAFRIKRSWEDISAQIPD